jgi:caffeoyl-CoA O-methyltransferase
LHKLASMTVTEYLARTHHQPLSLLLELEEHGGREGEPIVERETGRLLSTMVHAMQANRILEIGTGLGYSTLWMALALPPAGRIWSIDPNRAYGETARAYCARAGVADAVEMIHQPALEILPSFSPRNLDIIFIDGRKEEYTEYLELSVPLLKRSGLLIMNDLLHPLVDPDSHRTFLHHPKLDATILPLGKGLGLGARVA